LSIKQTRNSHHINSKNSQYLQIICTPQEKVAEVTQSENTTVSLYPFNADCEAVYMTLPISQTGIHTFCGSQYSKLTNHPVAPNDGSLLKFSR